MPHLTRLLPLLSPLLLSGCLMNGTRPLPNGAAVAPGRAIVVYGIGIEGQWRYPALAVTLDEYSVATQAITGNCLFYNRVMATVPTATAPVPLRYAAFDVAPGNYAYSSFNGAPLSAARWNGMPTDTRDALLAAPPANTPAGPTAALPAAPPIDTPAALSAARPTDTPAELAATQSAAQSADTPAFSAPPGKIVYIGDFVYTRDNIIVLRRDLDALQQARQRALPDLGGEIVLAETQTVARPQPFLCTP